MLSILASGRGQVFPLGNMPQYPVATGERSQIQTVGGNILIVGKLFLPWCLPSLNQEGNQTNTCMFQLGYFVLRKTTIENAFKLYVFIVM